MPNLADHQTQSGLKLLLIADSGEGKSGSLASLAKAGYKLRILDMDNGLDVLKNILAEHAPAALNNVTYETLTDKVKGVAGKVMPDGSPTAFATALRLMTRWEMGKRGEPGYYDLGPVSSWGKEDVLVLDSLTFFSNAALRYVLALNARSGQQPYQSDWGDAMRMVEDTLSLLYSDAVKCNVIVTSHITHIGNEDSGGVRGYPNTLGQKLPPKIPSYFNSCLKVVSKGTGATQKRYIKTVSEPLLSLKNPNPGKIPAEIEFKYADGGLATYFEILQGKLESPAKPVV